jgi:hypothetical protein
MFGEMLVMNSVESSVLAPFALANADVIRYNGFNARRTALFRYIFFNHPFIRRTPIRDTDARAIFLSSLMLCSYAATNGIL